MAVPSTYILYVFTLQSFILLCKKNIYFKCNILLELLDLHIYKCAIANMF